MSTPWSLGLDIGASATKAVLLEGTAVTARALQKSGADFTAAAKACLDDVTTTARVEPSAITRITATGYGRHSIGFATHTVTEITCHARGCYATFPQAMTVVDIGGQDNKVIIVQEGGDRRNFKMNRKCAAGTGAFLEEIANSLNTPVSTLNGLAEQATGGFELGSFCTVFAKTELLALIAKGTPLPDIVKAAFRSVVKRILEMDPLDGPVVMTGGVVAHNPVIVDLVSEALDREVLVPDHPQHTGALGAALIGQEQSRDACNGD
ncbi:MAG: acyl-CoA dehydratase activase [Phycisphaerae bacterium]|jgi:predicted CoA-substrate-specific enzyme activase